MKSTTINTLNNDILFGIFNYYRLDDENSWNVRLGWCKISHVCRRWRHVAHSSAFHLGMHILCTNGTPKVDTLDHLPSLPLFIDYQDATATITREDELAIRYALLLRDRVRRIVLHLPPSILRNILMFMSETFSILEHLSLSSTSKEATSLVLPKTFLAPNLRHLTLLDINRPKRLRLLSSTVYLVSLALTHIRASGYFNPRLLVARLESLPQLKELSIGFCIPIPRPSSESELLGKQGTPVTLPNLKHLTFQGVSSYLECFVAQIRAPLLKQLHLTLFNQILFILPHLAHLVNTTDGFTFSSATVSFGNKVAIIVNHQPYGHLTLRVLCNALDWQIDCAAQICSALMPVLSGVQKLMLGFEGPIMQTEWGNSEIDGTMWHELLRSFIGLSVLHAFGALSRELSRALQVNEVGLDPAFLPGLREIQFFGRADRLFGSFRHARQLAGRPVCLSITREADHVVALNNFLQGSPEGNVAHELQWMTWTDPNFLIIHFATVMLRGVSLGKGNGHSRGWAKRSAAQKALAYLAANGIPVRCG